MPTISKRKQLRNNQTIKSASCTVIFVNPTTMSKSYTLTIGWFQYSTLNSFYFVLSFFPPWYLTKENQFHGPRLLWFRVWDFFGNWYWNWNFWLLMGMVINFWMGFTVISNFAKYKFFFGFLFWLFIIPVWVLVFWSTVTALTFLYLFCLVLVLYSFIYSLVFPDSLCVLTHVNYFYKCSVSFSCFLMRNSSSCVSFF